MKFNSRPIIFFLYKVMLVWRGLTLNNYLRKKKNEMSLLRRVGKGEFKNGEIKKLMEI